MRHRLFSSFVIPGEARQRVDPEPSPCFIGFWVPDNAFGVSGMTKGVVPLRWRLFP